MKSAKRATAFAIGISRGGNVALLQAAGEKERK